MTKHNNNIQATTALPYPEYLIPYLFLYVDWFVMTGIKGDLFFNDLPGDRMIAVH
jgi:hypothetical protein